MPLLQGGVVRPSRVSHRVGCRASARGHHVVCRVVVTATWGEHMPTCWNMCRPPLGACRPVGDRVLSQRRRRGRAPKGDALRIGGSPGFGAGFSSPPLHTIRNVSDTQRCRTSAAHTLQHAPLLDICAFAAPHPLGQRTTNDAALGGPRVTSFRRSCVAPRLSSALAAAPHETLLLPC